MKTRNKLQKGAALLTSGLGYYFAVTGNFELSAKLFAAYFLYNEITKDL